MAISNEDLFSLIRLYITMNDEHREQARQTSEEPFKTLYEGVERFMETRRNKDR